MKMTKKDKSIRLLAIIKLLEHRENPTLARICRIFKCTKRTIYRDLGLLKQSGVPIRVKDGRYSINKSAWNNVSAKDLMRKRR